jgi:hypothetical protein
MEREKIIFFRNVFLRAFAVGVLFALFYWIVTLTLWHTYSPWLSERFNIDKKELGALTLNFSLTFGWYSFSFSCPGTGFALEREEGLSLVIAGIVKELKPNEQWLR